MEHQIFINDSARLLIAFVKAISKVWPNYALLTESNGEQHINLDDLSDSEICQIVQGGIFIVKHAYMAKYREYPEKLAGEWFLLSSFSLPKTHLRVTVTNEYSVFHPQIRSDPFQASIFVEDYSLVSIMCGESASKIFEEFIAKYY